MEFIKKNKYYLIFGVIFLIGIIMIIIGSSARNNRGIVIDNSLYYIDFVGENEITIYKGENYIEPGYKGYDDKGTDLTSNVEVTNNINSDVIGAYKVIYSLKNVVKERTVNVINKEPGATYIHLYGEVNTFLYVGEEYQEKGYEVIDTVDGGKLKDKVKVVSNVDTSKAGVYRVTYTVTNSSGITTTATRTVVVMNSEISVAINNNNYTNGNVKIEIYINDDMFEYLLLPDGNKVKEKIYTYQVTENGTYKFVMYNKKGQNKEESITVNNINKSNPSGSCSGSYKDGKTYINISASDDIGIARYVIDGASYTTNQITINREMNSANVTIYDKAGNSTNISCNLDDKNFYGDIKNIDSRYSPKYIVNNKNISLNYYVSSNNKKFSYWVYLPDKVTANLPIIMFMGGLGEIGDDYANNSQIAVSLGPIAEVLKHGYSYNAIIVHMQVPSGKYVYEYLPSYVELLNKIADEFKANKKKISVMGFSHGCYGVMNLIPVYQTYFSAAVPIGCDPKDRAGSFVSTPTWAFAGGGDGVRSMPGFVNTINNMGGYAKFDRPPYHNHNVVGDAYSILRDDNYKVIDWMTSQTR